MQNVPERSQGDLERPQDDLPPGSPRDDRVSDFWAESEGLGLQPDGLLSHQAMKGKFSLQNILSTNHGSTFDRPSDSVSPDDPIRCGLVGHESVVCLFERWAERTKPNFTF
jgi:hypothetical protein